MRVLLIDDDPAAAEALRDAFAARRLEAELTVAENAVEGLRRLRREPGKIDVLLANPSGWPGRLPHAVGELRAAAPQAALLALLETRGHLIPDRVVEAGFDDAFLKHACAYPALARLVVELAERAALARQQLRLSQARSERELLLAGVLAASDAAIAIVDREGVVTVANAQLGRLVGRPLADLLRHPLWPLLRDDAALALRAALDEPPPSRVANAAGSAFTLVAKDGAEVATVARIVTRDLGEGQRAAVLHLRPAAPAAAVPAVPRAAPPRFTPAAGAHTLEASTAADPFWSVERLRAAVRARRTSPVVARIRLGDPRAAAARAAGVRPGGSGNAPAEATAVLRAALRPALRELLGEEDLCFASADDTFVLLGDDGALEPMRRLARTVPALRDALLGSSSLAHDLLALGGASLVEQLPALCEPQVVVASVELPPEETAGHDDLPGLLARRLLAEEAMIGAETLRALNGLRAQAVCELRMVQDRDGAPSALCLPKLDEASASRLAALIEEAETRPDLALQLAVLQLELAADALEREIDPEGTLAVVDLHFAVLGHRRLADRYLDRCRALPPELARGLVVNLLAVPPGAYAPKFARVTAALREVFRFRALTTRDVRADLVDLDAARIGLVLVDYRDLEPFLDGREDAVQALVRRVHRSQARLLVRNAPRRAAIDLRERLGVDLTSPA